VTKIALSGTESLVFAHLTTASASGIRKGGSMSAAAFEPTISVVTLERPFSEEERVWVCSIMLGRRGLDIQRGETAFNVT